MDLFRNGKKQEKKKKNYAAWEVNFAFSAFFPVFYSFWIDPLSRSSAVLPQADAELIYSNGWFTWQWRMGQRSRLVIGYWWKIQHCSKTLLVNSWSNNFSQFVFFHTFPYKKVTRFFFRSSVLQTLPQSSKTCKALVWVGKTTTALNW